MRVLVLGGTGPIGIQLIQQCLAKLHIVVVFARSPQKLPDTITSHSSVIVIQGQLTDVDALSKAMEGVEVVLSALGPPVKSGPLYPGDTPLTKAYALVIETMKNYNVKRIIALGTASMKDENDRFSLQFSLLVSGVAIFAHNAYKDVVAIGQTIRASREDLMWTIARVPLLMGNEEDKRFVAGYIGDGKTKTTLSKSAYAEFVIHEMETNEWCRKAPMISSP